MLVTDNKKEGDVWAIALSADGNYLASSSINGKINVWSLSEEGMPKIREYETKGSFGLCVDLVRTLSSKTSFRKLMHAFRAQMGVLLLADTKMDPSTYSTTTLAVSPTLSPDWSILFALYPSAQLANCWRRVEMLRSLRYMML